MQVVSEAPRSDSKAMLTRGPHVFSLPQEHVGNCMCVWTGSVWPRKVAGVGNGQVNGRYDKCGQGPGTNFSYVESEK